MMTRAAPLFGACLCLALIGARRSYALSLRSSAAEVSLGDVVPGTTVVLSKANGAKLRVENSGGETAQVEFKVVSPPLGRCKDGYDPWPYPEGVHVEMKAGSSAVVPNGAAEADLSVTAPKGMPADGGQYEIDVVATGRDRTGGSLSLKTRVLLGTGRLFPSAAVDARAPGFTLALPDSGLEQVPWKRPADGSGVGTTLKIVDAGDEDVAVSLSGVRVWSRDVAIAAGSEPAPNPRWLRFDPEVIKVRAGAIGRARIWADIPRQSRYAGRRFAFVVAADGVSAGIGARRYVVFYAQLEREEESTRAR